MNDHIQPHALLWIDIETTGLDPQTDGILEIYAYLTEPVYPYRRLEHTPLGSVHYFVDSPHRERLLSGGVNDYVTKMHDKSGLTANLRDETKLTTIATIEDDLLHMSNSWPAIGTPPEESTERRDFVEQKVRLAGSSVHFDLSFLRSTFPTFANRLSHRTFDVTNVMTLCRSLGMPRIDPPEGQHRAVADLTNSRLLLAKCLAWLYDNGLRVPNVAAVPM